MIKLWTYIESLMYIAWIGLHVSVGYVVAPVLFHHLEKMVAGNLAGELFHVVSYTAFTSCVLLMIGGFLRYKDFYKKPRFYCILVSFLLCLVSEYLLTPVIVALKTHTNQAFLLNYFPSHNFMMWHGVSQIVYLITITFVFIHWFLWVRDLNRY